MDKANSVVSINDIEFLRETFQQRKLHAQMVLLVNSTKQLKEKSYQSYITFSGA